MSGFQFEMYFVEGGNEADNAERDALQQQLSESQRAKTRLQQVHYKKIMM